MKKPIDVCIICGEYKPEKIDLEYPHLCKEDKEKLDREQGRYAKNTQ
jgi:hypothetical protein